MDDTEQVGLEVVRSGTGSKPEHGAPSLEHDHLGFESRRVPVPDGPEAQEPDEDEVAVELKSHVTEESSKYSTYSFTRRILARPRQRLSEALIEPPTGVARQRTDPISLGIAPPRVYDSE